MNTFEIPLQGLNCMGCARKVEKQLNDNLVVTIGQLSPTSISLTTNASFADIAKQVTSLGYHAGVYKQFALSGLNCGKCVNKLTEHLATNDAISEVNVSKTELSLYTLLSDQAVIDLVAEVGYQASLEAQSHQPDVVKQPETDTQLRTDSFNIASSDETVSINLLIGGMTCASCVASVEKTLLAVEGVDKAQVNLAEQSALVIGASQVLVEQDLLDAVASAGYQAQIIADPATQQQKQLEQQQQIQAHHKRSAWYGLAVGGPLMAWGILGGNMMIRNLNDQLIWGAIGLICLALLATAGRSFFSNAWLALKHGRATMDTLVALGTGAAWLFSMLIVIVPQWFPEASRHIYFEASAMIIGLISLGHYIEAKAKANTTRSLQALIDLQPKSATLVTENGDREIAVELIEKEMKLRIKPGEKVPVDGVVVAGHSYIDESMLTGEPMPVDKQVDSNVSAGTLNQDGSLVITATSVGHDTMLARIISLVRQAQSSKPAIAKLADRISAVFVPVVVAIAIIAALVWYVVGPDPKASYMLVVATTVLIIACPCALGLATPLSVTVGVGKAAEMGILIRDADVLQSASKLDCVVFDKTGTLTQGAPSVEKLFSAQEDTQDLLSLAASLEQQSEHPLAKAIVEHAKLNSAPLYQVSNFENMRGQGVKAELNQEKVAVISLPHAQSVGIDLDAFSSALQECQENAWTTVIVTKSNIAQGVIAIADPIKYDAAAAISALKKMGIRPIMLTGDNQTVANSIATQLGIQDVIAQVLPDEKANHIQQLKQQGLTVAMIGDGVNDAPALALADIGIAMGSGSDVAIESAQMTLLNSSPLAVVKAIELSTATVKNMKQNLFGAFIYNSLGIPIAAGVLYPAFGFLLSPVVAGAAMALSSITVVSNANRLRLFETTHRS
ncbi:heavy metal translocating P-type ATPase [Vibrio panuliri]|uniref:Copper-exporting P-type ATPase n=1 Tax=Vibrio panuliri TaxID=1381081 RepID=A0ABX3F760_9VIBR|nr:copper-translocating P-type ATPase [Vibrio panuliri]KAB1453719.1 heavy metal translocating P-type ATPase [Vibrio panuliri]OLQ86243.1 copper-translocating P-type ATPase [Vibrio panuliri]